ncbi:RluA family pseudouridine synthase [Anaerolineales bacterium]
MRLISDVNGMRLDLFLQDELEEEVSRGQVQKWIKAGLVLLNGQPTKASYQLHEGDLIDLEFPDESEELLEAKNIPLEIVYSDDDIAVIEKPAGMVVHPGTGKETDTIAHALLYHFPEVALMATKEANERLGIVHRLDKETSGLLVIAKNLTALNHLMGQFQDRTVEKSYIGLLERMPDTATGRVEAPIARDQKDRKKMAVARSGKPAITEYEVTDIDFPGGQALANIKIFTGRTHQIRVHMAFLRSPIVGDSVYGYRKQRIKMRRHFLHASYLSFQHPTTGEALVFNSELPVNLQNIMQKLRS